MHFYKCARLCLPKLALVLSVRTAGWKTIRQLQRVQIISFTRFLANTHTHFCARARTHTLANTRARALIVSVVLICFSYFRIPLPLQPDPDLIS